MKSVVLTRTILAVLSGVAILTLLVLTASGERRQPGPTMLPGLAQAVPAETSARGRHAHEDAIQLWVRSLHPD